MTTTAHHHSNNNSSSDEAEEEDAARRRRRLDTLAQVCARGLLLLLAFGTLRVWLSYGPAECPRPAVLAV